LRPPSASICATTQRSAARQGSNMALVKKNPLSGAAVTRAGASSAARRSAFQ
jgi:hypothetical protein